MDLKTKLKTRLLGVLAAIGYTLLHPFDTFNITVVRRYIDAQGRYIGELYEGDGRDARMIGASCDNMPLNVEGWRLPLDAALCSRYSFLDAMPVNTIRVGAMEPQDNAAVQEYVALRRWLPLRVSILNRFVERVMGEIV